MLPQSNQNASKHGQVPATRSPQSIAPLPTWKMADKATLSQALSRVCALQRQYGKTQGELETLVEGFAWALADYAPEQVIAALGQHIRSSPNIPTPSEIIAIIDPPKEPFKPDWSYYNHLLALTKEQGPYAVTQYEADYLAACERHSLGKMGGEGAR